MVLLYEIFTQKHVMSKYDPKYLLTAYYYNEINLDTSEIKHLCKILIFVIS